MNVVITLIISFCCCYCTNSYCFHLQFIGVINVKFWKFIYILAKINLY